MRLYRFLSILLLCLLLSSCTQKQTYFGEIPDLTFTPVASNEDGKPCFYLFDDNPEHLHKEFLADGASSSSIAHFDSLTPGIYTVFSYHHRGDAAAKDTDLFFDVLFRTEDTASFQITKIGLNHDWQWNQAWADFSGTDVYAPAYLKTANCICPPRQCRCTEPDGSCQNTECPCTVKDELTLAMSDSYDGLQIPSVIDRNTPILLSQKIPVIGAERINEIRHGGYNEPIWLMMEFEILSGEMTLDTIAYTDWEKVNVDAIKPGRLAQEPQYKGIAYNAPMVTAELSYRFDETTKPGPLPIRIFNQRHPEGYLARDGAFGTNVNTWKVKELIEAESAESDMMRLSYRDESKLSLYGDAVTDRTNLWQFDPYHTSLYADPENPDFIPNLPMSSINYPTGHRRTPASFYQNYVLNLGNFGVRYLYQIHLTNDAPTPKTFCFSMNSLSGQLYRYTLYEGETPVKDDGGQYLMKCFDMAPAENQKPAKYTTTEKFELEPNTSYLLNFEVVTLTGCDAPMTNWFSVE